MTRESMTIYLFAGDSLTEGTPGASYVERVGKALYRGRADLGGDVINAGRSGDTIKMLLNRVDVPLKRYRPQWVIYAVGTNDVWLPWLASHSLGWRLIALWRRAASGRVPTTDLDQFAAAYRMLIDKARSVAGAHVVACTVSPIGEHLASPVNRRLARLNGVIKHVATEVRVPVADVWQAFVNELALLPKPSNYVASEWLFAWLDRRRLASASPDEISRRRRLHLTYDGIHLNSRGADLWAETVVQALARAQHVEDRSSVFERLGASSADEGALAVHASPGWEERARALGSQFTTTYHRLVTLSGAQPDVRLAVLNALHWSQLAAEHPYPVPASQWEGEAGTIIVPATYSDTFLRDMRIPEAVASWEEWPPELDHLGAPARATALADLLVCQELSRHFLRALKAVPVDPAVEQLLACYLTIVALDDPAVGAGRNLLDFWHHWTAVLIRHGISAGQTRQQALHLYQEHGSDLIASIVHRWDAIRPKIAAQMPGARA